MILFNYLRMMQAKKHRDKCAKKALDTASGKQLDRVAGMLGYDRRLDENDEQFRARIKSREK